MSPTPDAAAQIQSIEQHLEGLRRALNRARGLRLLILVALVAVLVVIVYSFMSMAKRVSSESFVNEVTTLAQKHVTDHQDTYEKEMKQFVDKAYPVMSQAFTTQAQKDLPKFTEAFDKERETFVTHLRDRMDEKLAVKYKELLKQHEAIIVAEFPALKDEATRERVLANFQLVIEKLVKRNYGDQFEEESKKLIALWESFPAAEEPGQSDPKLEEKLLEHALQVAAGVMGAMQQANSANDPAVPVVTQPAEENKPAATTAAAPPKASEASSAETRKIPPPGDAPADAKPATGTAEGPKAESAKTDTPNTETKKPKEGEPGRNPPAPGEAPKN